MPLTEFYILLGCYINNDNYLIIISSLPPEAWVKHSKLLLQYVFYEGSSWWNVLQCFCLALPHLCSVDITFSVSVNPLSVSPTPPFLFQHSLQRWHSLFQRIHPSSHGCPKSEFSYPISSPCQTVEHFASSGTLLNRALETRNRFMGFLGLRIEGQMSVWVWCVVCVVCVWCVCVFWDEVTSLPDIVAHIRHGMSAQAP